jgi:hypothetical protein
MMVELKRNSSFEGSLEQHTNILLKRMTHLRLSSSREELLNYNRFISAF